MDETQNPLLVPVTVAEEEMARQAILQAVKIVRDLMQVYDGSRSAVGSATVTLPNGISLYFGVSPAPSSVVS